MKRVKYIFVTLANYIPVLCACLFYEGGGPLMWPIFIVAQIILIVLNHILSSKKMELIFYDVNLIISTIIANGLSTYLYYWNISSDSETPAVGQLGLMVGVIFVLILTFISVLLKRKNLNKRKNTIKNCENSA